MTNTDSFEMFVRNYQHMVFTTAVRLLGNEADAEDISQTVFLKAFERFDQLEHNPAVGGWLKSVTTNLSLNHLTRYRARWRFFTDIIDEESGVDYAETLAAPDTREQSLTESEWRDLLEAAIHKLPVAQRAPLVLFHFENFSYEEIASRLMVSLGKVKSDIHRARLRLRRYLNPGLLDDERMAESAGQSKVSAFSNAKTKAAPSASALAGRAAHMACYGTRI